MAEGGWWNYIIRTAAQLDLRFICEWVTSYQSEFLLCLGKLSFKDLRQSLLLVREAQKSNNQFYHWYRISRLLGDGEGQINFIIGICHPK